MATTPPPPLTDHSIRTSGANGQGEQKHVKEKDTTLTDLPEKMRAFLRKNDIPVSVYDNNAPVVPRFVRVLKKANLAEEDIKEIESELGTTLERTPLPGIYQLAEERGLHGTSGYKSGKLFGIDLASAFAVHALDLKQGMHALDLCCAPGAKLCMIAEAVASQGKPAVLLLPQRGQQEEEGENGRNKPSSIAPTTVRGGSVTGVDVALQRLNTCRNLIRKYRVMGVRLYLCDGARFGLPPSGEPILHCRILHVDESTGLSFDPKAAKKKKKKNKNKKVMAATIGRDSNCKNSNESNRSNKRRRTTTSNDDDETTTTTTTQPRIDKITVGKLNSSSMIGGERGEGGGEEAKSSSSIMTTPTTTMTTTRQQASPTLTTDTAPVRTVTHNNDEDESKGIAKYHSMKPFFEQPSPLSWLLRVDLQYNTSGPEGHRIVVVLELLRHVRLLALSERVMSYVPEEDVLRMR
mmetsp:Transcript_7646/g.12167  ORF Transcript_7646/g.12167 Transcript_7646/m.12167 type:complete len:464 (+) Transcript_7646:254-1645(+)